MKRFACLGTRLPGLLVLLLACGGEARAWSNVTFVAFDLETTGLDAGRDRVVEIGAVRFRGGRILARRAWLVNPGIPIPPGAQAVHGITPDMVADAPPFGRAYAEFVAFAGDAVLVAHNARFDLGFIAAETERNGLSVPTNAVLDSLTLARRWFPNAPGHALEALAAALGIGPPRLHRAGDDAATLTAVFLRGLSALPAATTLEDLVRQAGGALHVHAPGPLQNAAADSAP